jgi:hypothetical protein
MEVSDKIHSPGALPPRESPWYPLVRRLGGSQSRSGRIGEKKKIPSLCREPNPRIIQPVARRYTTELSLLLFDKSSESYLGYQRETYMIS